MEIINEKYGMKYKNYKNTINNIKMLTGFVQGSLQLSHEASAVGPNHQVCLTQ